MAARFPQARAGSGWLRARAARWAGLAWLSIGAFLIGCQREPPPVLLWGCSVLRADGSCQQDSQEPRELLLFVAVPRGTHVAADSVTSMRTAETDGGLLITVRPQSGARAISLRMSRGFYRYDYRLRLHPDSEVPWIREALRLARAEDPAHAERAIALLRQHLAEPQEELSAESRAQALRELGWLLRYKQGSYSEARDFYERAIAEDKKGHPLHQALDLLTLTDLLSRDLNRPDEAEELLQKNRALIQVVPHVESFWYIQLAVARQMRGDLRGSLRNNALAEPLARRYGNPYAYSSLGTSTVQTLSQLGRFREANRVLDYVLTKVPPSGETRCRNAGLLQDRAELELLLWESRPAGHIPPPQEDPRIPSELSQRLLSEKPCNLPEMRAAALTDLAHAAVLAGDYARAERHLTEARALLRQQNEELAPRWIDLEGMIALGRRQYAQAKKIYEGFLQSAEQRKSLHDAYDTYWRALSGIALALEPSQPAEALRYHRAAEHHLDIRSLEIPLGEGRGAYLGQHESGTRRYVEFLVRLAERAATKKEQEQWRWEALTAIRNARTRGVRTLTLLGQLGRLSGESYRAYRQELDRYEALRREYDDLTGKELVAASDVMPELARQKADVVARLREHQESALRLLARKAALAAPASLRVPLLMDDKGYGRPPQGEVLLTCHPGVTDWICLAASSANIQHRRIVSLTTAHDVAPKELSEQLLQPFSSLIAQAQELRVVAYGVMRDIDVHLLPFEDGLLRDKLKVYYAFDLPYRARPEAPAAERIQPAPPAALLHIDPLQSLPAARSAKPGIRRQLGENGFSVLPDPEKGAPEREASLLERLPRAELFVLFAHIEQAPGGSSHWLRTDETRGVLAPDILALSDVPRWIVLLGCETGLAAEETGGLEGLGLSQAFLASGSEWVIGTVRPVGDQLSARFAEELFRELKVDPKGQSDPTTALKLAQLRLGTRSTTFAAKDPVCVDRDTAAFRIFRP